MTEPMSTRRDSERAKRAVATYVQDRLREESATRGRIAEIARTTGFSTAHLANAKNHGSVGEDFARAMAQFWGLSFEDLRREALAAGPSSSSDGAGAATERVIELDPRYPNLSIAAAFCRHRVSPEAIGRVERMAHRSREDLPPERWLALIEAEDTRLSSFTPAAADDEQRSRELEDELAPPVTRSRH